MTASVKVLVTGGAGFIGSHLVDKLVEEGCKVKILDDLSNGELRNIEDHLVEGRVEFIEGSIVDPEAVKMAVADVDALVHLAAVVSVPYSVSNPRETFEVNAKGTERLLHQCAVEHVKKFIFVSSCGVYGEPRYVPVDEIHPAYPLSPYAASKFEAERICLKDCDTNGLETVVLRLFNVYGRRQGQNGYAGVITSFAERLTRGLPLIIYGDGLQKRDFVHVSDVVKAVWLALTKPGAEGVFNIASGKPVSINKLAKSMSKLVDIENPQMIHEKPRKGDIRQSHGDYSKAKKTLGFTPETELEDGLSGLLDSAYVIVDSVIREAPVL